MEFTTLMPDSPEIFDEYTRRQYVAKAPERNPYGIEEEPAKFMEFDTFTKVRNDVPYVHLDTKQIAN
jgi:hypothetical protein